MSETWPKKGRLITQGRPYRRGRLRQASNFVSDYTLPQSELPVRDYALTVLFFEGGMGAGGGD